MSFIKRYLEDVVDRLAKELNEDWCKVNDLFMSHVSDGLSVEDARTATRDYFRSVQKLRAYAKEVY